MARILNYTNKANCVQKRKVKELQVANEISKSKEESTKK